MYEIAIFCLSTYENMMVKSCLSVTISLYTIVSLAKGTFDCSLNATIAMGIISSVYIPMPKWFLLYDFILG